MNEGLQPTQYPANIPHSHLSRRKFFSGAIWYVVVIFLALTVVFPFIWMISTSFKPLEEVFVYPPRWIPQNWTWQNYAEVWKQAPFARYFINSTLVAVCVTIGQLISCSLAAFAFARMKFVGKSFMFMVFMSTTFISTQVTLIPSYLIINKFGWMDSFSALIIPFLANAFGVFMIRQSFMAVPRELEEAAKLDGCGRFRFLLQIMLPLNKPILASQALFAFMGNWNSYLWPLIVTNKDEMRTLQIGLRYFMGSEGGTEWGVYMAAAVLVTVPIILFYFFVQKTFVESMASSGLKDV
ncbi:ABC-type sugar transport system, permease component [Longilinea arvoryzae]|uniref:ABC-type sugar transport system, permease component n=1 Tax=Longilinea arvoryzae TaxID=360412 RepID=A0A0S7BJL1_9CHLR|nr:carbohydrate ABC transporter permease [Longilinea arvoryzae]GAP13989.1 ABC-type sugar transport system, permease component [Longilinea arvoryzae]